MGGGGGGGGGGRRPDAYGIEAISEEEWIKMTTGTIVVFCGLFWEQKYINN